MINLRNSLLILTCISIHRMYGMEEGAPSWTSFKPYEIKEAHIRDKPKSISVERTYATSIVNPKVIKTEGTGWIRYEQETELGVRWAEQLDNNNYSSGLKRVKWIKELMKIDEVKPQHGIKAQEMYDTLKAIYNKQQKEK